MATTLQNYINSINKRIVDESGGTLSSTAIVEFVNTALRRIRRNFDPPQSESVSQTVVYNGVQLYALPSGFKEFIGVYDNYRMTDLLNFKKVDEFDFWRNYPGSGNLVSESRDQKNRYLLLSLLTDGSLTNSLVQNCDTYNGNGTWTANTATSDAANVASDTLYVMEGSGSVKFDITVAQSVNNYAELSNSTMTSVDLSGDSLASIGTMTMWVWLPSIATQYTSFTLRWGSSSANYYESTVTTDIGGGAFVQGWNQLGFDWTTATTTGTPSNSAITYLLFRATYPSTMTNQTGLRIDAIFMRQKKVVNLHYFTDYMVVDGTSGALKESFDSATDTSSYFNCDASFVDWITFSTMEDVFTYYKVNPNNAAYNRMLREELEMEIYRRFPSRRENPTKSYIETDSLADLLN